MVLTRTVRSCPGGNEEGNTSALPFSPKQPSDAPRVQIHPFSSGNENDGLIVKIQPPREPRDASLHHVPCDLVLSIDVSGSMNAPAPAPSKPGEPDEEDAGLSVLDLVKHAARTIVETLDENDRLGIVTFALHSKVVQELTPMTNVNKATTLEKIKAMRPEDVTNLWHGVRDGLGLFEPGSSSRAPALLVMTDGLPNTCIPGKGYVPSLQPMMPLPATIHTFGFGYSLKSGLLKSIAEIGGGNYSFIPDAGMLGTVFIHAVANLQSTFATNAKLRLTYPSYLKLEETTGKSVVQQEPVYIQGDVPEPLMSLTIPLGNLQYGQSRDIYLRYGDLLPAIQAAAAAGGTVNPSPLVTAILEHQEFTPTTHQTVAHQNLFTFPPQPALDPAEIAYHISRSAIIAFLSTFFPLNAELEHKTPQSVPPNTSKRFRSLLADLPASRPEFASHAGCRSLMEDLRGPLPADMSEDDEESGSSGANTDPSTWSAQIPLALLGRAESYGASRSSKSHFKRWGAHFLPALAGAHARQICHSFKDPGPLQYGVDSPLFKKCRDRLDEVFDTLPPPEGSLVPRLVQNPPSYSPPAGYGNGGVNYNGNGHSIMSMRSYNDSARGCFAGCMGVLLADAKVIRVGKLRKGMEVITPRGPRKVQALLRIPVQDIGMCLVPGRSGPDVNKGAQGRNTALLVTPWHPVTTNSEGPWVFPKDIAVRSVRYTGAVYSVLLERDEDPDAHAIFVGGVWGVAMGHGLTQPGTSQDGVRAHQFYGDYDKVSRALARLPMRSGGVMMGGGLTRDAETGLVNGFKMAKVGGYQARDSGARDSEARGGEGSSLSRSVACFS